MAFLDSAVEDLYVAFADVLVPQHVEGCPCCTDAPELRRLLTTARRLLTADDLGRYPSKAISTIGGKDDYLYFFPRIVELMIADPGWGPNWEIVFDKIGETEPATWPSKRRHGLEAYLLAALEGSSRYAEDDSNIVIDDLVCCAGRSGIDLAPWLEALLAYPELVIDFYRNNSDAARTGELRNAFWGNRNKPPIDRMAPALAEIHRHRRARHNAAQAIVVDWLQSDQVLAIITDPANEG